MNANAFCQKEVFIGFDLNVLEILGKMKAEGGISERIFPTNGNLQDESMSIWSIIVMKLFSDVEFFSELVDKDE
jgi:hypothetical protein